MNGELSLLSYCMNCHAKCCQSGVAIGFPILSEDEVHRINEPAGVREIHAAPGKSYFVTREKNGGQCYFLADGACAIQSVKPLDCACYPVKAVPGDNHVRFVVDGECEATRHINGEFFDRAKIVALQSMSRFDRVVYEHWLANHIGWVRRSAVEI
jgi:Fe-S-cluster containining protein